MWAQTIDTFGRIAIVAKDLKTFWVVIPYNPVNHVLGAPADFLPVFIPSAVDMIYTKEFAVRLPATSTFSPIVRENQRTLNTMAHTRLRVHVLTVLSIVRMAFSQVVSFPFRCRVTALEPLSLISLSLFYGVRRCHVASKSKGTEPVSCPL